MPSMDGPCCWLELCCPPQKAAAALAEHLAAGELHAHDDDPSNTEAGSYLDIATRLLAEFQLVPRVVEPVTTSGDPVPVYPVNARLEALHAHIKAELRAILLDAGHRAGEEA